MSIFPESSMVLFNFGCIENVCWRENKGIPFSWWVFPWWPGREILRSSDDGEFIFGAFLKHNINFTNDMKFPIMLERFWLYFPSVYGNHISFFIMKSTSPTIFSLFPLQIPRVQMWIKDSAKDRDLGHDLDCKEILLDKWLNIVSTDWVVRFSDRAFLYTSTLVFVSRRTT